MLLLMLFLCGIYALQPYENDTEIVGGITGWLCWSCVPFIAFWWFALMAWRNAVGLREARRHNELIRTMQNQTGIFKAANK